MRIKPLWVELGVPGPEVSDLDFFLLLKEAKEALQVIALLVKGLESHFTKLGSRRESAGEASALPRLLFHERSIDRGMALAQLLFFRPDVGLVGWRKPFLMLFASRRDSLPQLAAPALGKGQVKL